MRGFMSGFLARAERMRAQQTAGADQHYTAKVLAQVCKYFEIDVRAMKDDPEFGFAWFHREYAGFPIRLEGRRGEIDLDKAIRDMPKSRVWNTYMQLLEETSAEKLALIVPLTRGSLCVVHNWWTLNSVPGYTRIMHRALSENKGVILEPLGCFLESIKQSGYTP